MPSVCFRLSGFQYQRQTSRDQKPHKSAAFSSDRMYSGCLMKVAVKPSPPILMFHFNICTPGDFSQYHLCSSAIIPFNCKTRFLRQCNRSSHLILTKRMSFFFLVRVWFIWVSWRCRTLRLSLRSTTPWLNVRKTWGLICHRWKRKCLQQTCMLLWRTEVHP